MPSKNTIRTKLENDEVVFGASTTTMSPILIDVYGDLGLDYIWYDHEHIGSASTNGPQFESIARAAGNAGIEPLVRIETGAPHAIRKVLDAGVRSLVIPRIETAAEVEESVRASRFAYDGAVGDRGVGTCLASNWGNPPEEYIEAQDDTVLLGVMIENASAVDNIHEIFSVPGVGFGWVGPSDLSVSLGHPLERDHPAVQGAIQTVIDASHETGVPLGISAGYAGGVEETVDAGYNLVKFGSEVSAARQIMATQLETGRRAATSR